MRPSEIRRALLEEHEGLRVLIDATCGATERWERGEASARDARDCFVQLVDAQRRHNLREEELLRDVIPAVDAWGPVRAEIMSEEHIKEHEELYAALLETAAATDAKATASTVRGLRDRMLAHMDSEERAFLGKDALRDDDTSVDSFGG